MFSVPQKFDDFIFAFFSLEMTIKMIAMGVYGKGSYLADSWNRLDLFIVLAGAVEYGLPDFNDLNLSPVRTIRVLRPLRAINRIPSKYTTKLNHIMQLVRKFHSVFFMGDSTLKYMKESSVWQCLIRALWPFEVDFLRPVFIFYLENHFRQSSGICYTSIVAINCVMYMSSRDARPAAYRIKFSTMFSLLDFSDFLI